MKIVIDGRMYQESGVGRYIRNLLAWLQNLDKTNQYYILLLKNEYKKIGFNSNFHKILADFKWYGVLEQALMPGILNKIQPDLVHFPHFNTPVFYKGKFIVTIHDLIHQNFSMRRASSHGKIIYRLKQFGYNRVFRYAINKSLKIIVPSNFVKEGLIQKWAVPDKKITVTYEGVDEEILEIAKKIKANNIEKILEKFKINNPYIFYVGNAHPHKNLEGLIKSYLALKVNNPSILLVLSGSDHYFWKKLREENKYDGIIYTGYISDEELVSIYKRAECFVMPSFEEGFGIPLLEAMALSCPVVSSNLGALPEVAADAAIYFDPNSIEDMVKKITKVLDFGKLREQLIDKGKERVKDFSWKKMAEQTLGVYYSCV